MTSSPTHGSAAASHKVGLLGGTFNPIHRCHLLLAHEVQHRLKLDTILFIPTGDPPHKSKQDLASARHRAAMVRLAIADTPSFQMSDIEVRRHGVSYSIDTVTELQREMGAGTELHFLIGLDAFLELATWRRAADLLTACHFVVVSRPGASFAQLATMQLLPSLDAPGLRRLDHGAQDAATVPLPTGRRLILLALPPCLVSASQIRTRFAQGLGAEGLLPAPVERYIIREGLYQESHNPTRLQG